MNTNCLNLHFTSGLGNLSFGRLMEKFGDCTSAINASQQKWQECGIQAEVFANSQMKHSQSIAKVENWLSQSPKNHLVCYGDNNYPNPFYELIDPPAVLYCKGNLKALKQHSFAIVGSRDASPMGRKTAQEFSYKLAQSGLTICSGLAQGIDLSAHLGALSANGYTVPFMGTGIDQVYPKQHHIIADQIVAENGLLVSEFKIGTLPKSGNFPRRNRLISGLSNKGVLIVESKIKAGSMITARTALEQGRDVFAIPGSIHSPLSEGCHLLIQQGAKLVYRIEDIVGEINDHPLNNSQTINTKQREEDALSAEQKQILYTLQYEIMRLEEIARLSKIPLQTVQQNLLEMEIDDWVQSLSGNRWQRK